MKISTGGIGTVASLPASNAPTYNFSAFPGDDWQWAWNFAGEDVTGSAFAVNTTTIEAVATGVKWNMTGTAPFVDCADAHGTVGKISGALNAGDTGAYYMHSLIDFSGSSTLASHLESLGGVANLTDFEFYWFNAGGKYEGSDAIAEFTTGDITVLVHDMRNMDALYAGDAGGNKWIDRDGEEPITIENYFNSIAADGESIIHHGYILANRILDPSEISIPIDISNAVS